MRRFAFKAILIVYVSVFGTQIASALEDELLQRARDLFSQSDSGKISDAISYFRERDNKDSVGILLLAMRFASLTAEVGDALKEITGEDHGTDWDKWMLWQERNPDAKPFAGFDDIHAEVHARVDGNFRLFLGSDKNFTIRTEEITWGGVRKDGIPALTNPIL
ncbi:MAG: hypothetical protein AAF412_13815, partial [Pseudomonadota bacterium]